MKLYYFLRDVETLVTLTVDIIILFFALKAHRRTAMRAFSLLIFGSAVGIVMTLGRRVFSLSVHGPEDNVFFGNMCEAGYCFACVAWGIAIYQLIQYVVGQLSAPPLPAESKPAIRQ